MGAHHEGLLEINSRGLLRHGGSAGTNLLGGQRDSHMGTSIQVNRDLCFDCHKQLTNLYV